MASPRKVVIGDLETGEYVELQFNPQKLKLSLEASWSRVQTPGSSFQDLQFGGTGNIIFEEFEVRYDALGAAGPDLIDKQNFLLSLLYPPQDVDAVATGAPPRVLVSWPGWIAVKTTVPKIEIDFSRFAFDGEPTPTYFTAKVKLEERRTTRIGFSQVRQRGLRRTA